MKVGQVPSANRVTQNDDVHRFFKHHRHRTVLSQRALQAHADPWIGHTVLDEKGQLVSEFSPYTADLDWDDINLLARQHPGTRRVPGPGRRQNTLCFRCGQRPKSGAVLYGPGAMRLSRKQII